MDVTFPIVCVRDSRFTLTGLTHDTQESLSGEIDAPASMSGRWTAQLSFLLRGEGDTLAWQAFIAQMNGRRGRTDVPALTRFRPYDRDGHPVSQRSVAGLADAQTWEHFGFASEPVVTATVVQSAPLRATRLRVTWNNTTGLRPGQFFSIRNRLYRVRLHWVDQTGVPTIEIQPPLREAVPVGGVLVMDRPVCRMAFATDEEGTDWSQQDRLPIVTVNFIEARGNYFASPPPTLPPPGSEATNTDYVALYEAAKQ